MRTTRTARSAPHLVRALPGKVSGRGDVTVKVGVHTDQVVLAEPTHAGGAPALQGEAPGVAAWLATQAGPGTVLLSGGTHALVRGGIQSQCLGERPFPGLSGTSGVVVHQLLQARQGMSRFTRARAPGTLTPLVGRRQELQRLMAARRQALDGQGSLVLLRGEAGIGKSRLLHELYDREPPDTRPWAWCQCWLQDATSAFHPLLTWLLETLGMPQEHRASWMSLVLGSVDPDASCVPGSPERHQAEVLEAWVTFLRREASQRPLVLVVEDVHWSDPSTLRVIGALLDHLEDARLCVLLTSRPGFQPPWAAHPRIQEVEVEPLSAEDSACLVRSVAGGQPLAPETLTRLVTSTDGIPLFVEELTREVLREGPSGPGPVKGPRLLPATLQALLHARLDQLPPRQRTQVQLAATLGREFSYDLLRAVSGLPEDALLAELEGLERARLLFRTDEPPHATYVFRHALVQEAAYQSLPRGARQRHHARVAQALAAHFPEVMEEQPELLAQHATLAGQVEQAVEHWQRAGQLATMRAALSEAVSHYSRALEQLARLPHSRERDQRELALCGELSIVLFAVKGYGSQEARALHARAQELCAEGNDLPLLVLWGLWNRALDGGDHATTERLARQCQQRLATHDDLKTRMVIHGELAHWSFWRGDYARALRHGQEVKDLLGAPGTEGLLLDARGMHLDVQLQMLTMPGVVALCQVALGYVDQARATFEEGLALAEALRHPYVIAGVLVYGGILAIQERDLRGASAMLDRSLALCAERRFPFLKASGLCAHGCTTAWLGDTRAGIEEIHEGLALVRCMGTRLLYPPNLTCLAVAYLLDGQLSRGLATADEALAEMKRLRIRHHLPDLHLVRGELLRQQGEDAAARASFQQALETARALDARLHVLRAAQALTPFLLASGETETARALLAEGCEGIPEPGGLLEVEAARGLLTSLTPESSEARKRPRRPPRDGGEASASPAQGTTVKGTAATLFDSSDSASAAPRSTESRS
jgi:tetratricopeptide (TPR) repeat protein